MDRQTRDSLISIMTSSEGADILKSIVSACQSLQSSESANTKPKKFNMLESLFYGELYEIGRSLQHAVDASGSTLPEEVQADLNDFMSCMAVHNIIDHSACHVSNIYAAMGLQPPIDTPLIDILRGLHKDGYHQHNFLLTSCKHAADFYSTERMLDVAGYYPGSMAKVYIGDKSRVSIHIKALSADNWSTSNTFPLPMVVVSHRDLDLYYPEDVVDDAAHYDTAAYSFFQAGEYSRCQWAEKRNLTNNTTTFLPEISYVAPNDGSYTATNLNVVLDDTILDNGNIKWLYVGVNDYYLDPAGETPRILQVVINSEYDNYYVRN